jgi:tetratricopeptide (TPR) repeat protein
MASFLLARTNSAPHHFRAPRAAVAIRRSLSHAAVLAFCASAAHAQTATKADSPGTAPAASAVAAAQGAPGIVLLFDLPDEQARQALRGSGTQPTTPDTVETALRHGYENWLGGRPRLALFQARKTIALGTGSDALLARAHLLAGVSAMQLGEREAARKYLGRALELDPRWWRPAFEMAWANDEEKMSEAAVSEASALLMRAASLDPKQAAPRVRLGRLFHLRRGDLERAEAEYTKALEIEPQNASAANGLANVLFDRFDFLNAAAWFRRACDWDAAQPVYRINLANALLHLNKRSEALIEARTAVASGYSGAHPVLGKLGVAAAKPPAPSPWSAQAPLPLRLAEARRSLARSEEHLSAKQLAAAQEEAQKALALLDWAFPSTEATPTQAPVEVGGVDESARSSAHIQAGALHVLGRVAQGQGEPKASERWLLHSLALRRDAVPMLELAGILLSSPQPSPAVLEAAEGWLQAATSLQPGDPRPQSALGELMVRRNTTEAAQKYFERALELDSKDARALYGLGELASSRGQRAEAEKYFLRSAEAEPGNPSMWNRLATLTSTQSNNAAETEKYLRHALEADPNFAPALANLGVLLMNTRRDWRGAEPLLRRATEAAPTEPRYQLHLAFCLLQQARRSEAIDAARKARELGFTSSHPVFAALGVK